MCWVWIEHFFLWEHRSLGVLAGQEGMPISKEHNLTSFYFERNTASIGQRRLLGMLWNSQGYFVVLEDRRKGKTGAGGIRTPGTVLPVQRFSKPPHSTALPPHQE